MALCTRRRVLTLLVVLILSLCLFCEVFVFPWQTQWNPKYFTTYKTFPTFVQTFPEFRPTSNKTAQILLWTKWFGHSTWSLDFANMFKSCEVSNCKITLNKTKIWESDALMFHVGDLPKVYDPSFMPPRHLKKQVWILQNSEPATKMERDLSPYKGTFNWTATYRRDSEIYMPYFTVVKKKSPVKHLANIASNKTRGVAWVASNCRDSVRRQVLVKELRKHIHVDTFGECGDKQLSRGALSDQTLSQYKFYLAFENSYCVDYVTEKFSSALGRLQLPIVSGAADYAAIAPPNSYISVLDFESVQHLASYIKYLDKNDTAYNSYFQWTKHYELDKRSYMERGLCDICKRLHDVSVTSQVYPDVSKYFSGDICPVYTYLREKYSSIQGWLIHFGYV